VSPLAPVVMLSALLLASCASTLPGTRTTPPPELLQDCPEPTATVRTNRQLADYATRLRDALRGCNRDKAALREWATTD
jgi:hypothetical protein